MNTYEITIEDIYDKNSFKKLNVEQPNAKLAHKMGLNYCNAIREEISKITLRGRTVYSFKSGFFENE